jgi:hypothetical protein
MLGGMWQHWILREPALAFGLPVYLLAALVFPLHLGWIGTSWLALACYLVVATALLSVADALLRPGYYPSWTSIFPQSVLSLLVLVAPAALAFGIGALAGPVDEANDEKVCASRGAGESDTPEAESDDTFDVTPDCIVKP